MVQELVATQEVSTAREGEKSERIKVGDCGVDMYGTMISSFQETKIVETRVIERIIREGSECSTKEKQTTDQHVEISTAKEIERRPIIEAVPDCLVAEIAPVQVQCWSEEVKPEQLHMAQELVATQEITTAKEGQRSERSEVVKETRIVETYVTEKVITVS
ncbi:unnamed protein product [Strongylus vulgaris]|uniref:Uncharacterized protein n=1 Tax=Strongylus vulgaris TaxID=40348 RepID=A0A3P7ID23_STRVU|nr:unnamed protein product [Strongylus vulgaris]